MDVVKYVDYGYKSILYIKVYNNNNIQKNIDKQSVLSYVIYKYIYIICWNDESKQQIKTF